MDQRRDIGDRGEDLVANYLVRRGWLILERNWRTAAGELDLVCRDPEGALVACEVKTRRGSGRGSPLEAITHDKVRRLRRLVVEWVRARDVRAQTVRVDAFGVLLHADGTASVEHVPGVEP